jgi:hypothetical protein
MAVIPDNTGTTHDFLEAWAIQHMGRDVAFSVGQRELICKKCPSYDKHQSKLFVRCGQSVVSLAGGACPEKYWGVSSTH